MASLISDLISIFLGVLLYIPVGSLILPIYFIFYCCSRVVHKLAEYRRPDLLPLSKVDSFLTVGPSDSDSSRVLTCQIWKLNGRVDLAQFQNYFHTLFLSTPEDRNRYQNLYCYFVEYFGYVFKKRVDSLDLSFHIQEMSLEEEGYASLEEFVGKWMVTHFTQDGKEEKRPSWQIKIISNQVGGKSSVVFKLHHGICDGYTMVHLVGKLSGEHAPYIFKENLPPLQDRVKYLIQFPFILTSIWTRIHWNRSRSLETMYSSNKSSEEDWLISFSTLDLGTVKEIRRVTKTNFVTVLMAVQIGAVRRLMIDFDPERVKRLKNTIIGHSMGWPNHPVMTEGGGMANHLTLNMIKASLNIDDPMERLLDLDKNFRHTKSIGYPYLSYNILYNMFKHQPAWASRFLLNGDFSIGAMDTALSSLLCSEKKHYLMGNAVENLYLPVITPSLFPRMKLLTVPVSHSGQLDVSINASSALVKDQAHLDRLTQVYFPEELDALKKRCQVLFE